MMDRGSTNLLQAALDSGFGSYAQFHRVFRARLQATPREYLRPGGGDRRRLISFDKTELAGPAPGVRQPSK